MPCFIEMLIKSPPTHIHEIPAYLAWKLDAQTMQLVKPIRNRLAIPGQWELERVVDLLVARRVALVVGTTRPEGGLGRLGEEGVKLLLALTFRHALSALNVDACVGTNRFHCGCKLPNTKLSLGDGTFFEVFGAGG